MRQIVYKLKKIPNYLSRFGFFWGIWLFFTIEKSVIRDSNEVESIKVPGFAEPINLRSTISDHSAFWICMVAEQYNVDRFPNHARRLHSTYEKMLRDGKKPLIIDAGANIGMSALWFTYKYPEAYIFAIEPDRDNYELLVKNTQGQGGKIIPFFGGIWPRDAKLSIDNRNAGAQHFQTSESQIDTQDTFNAITVDKILSQFDIESLFIAKIDIEGSQKELFEENTDWVKCTNLIVLELDDWLLPWAGTSRPFFSCVSKYPFDYLLDGENIFCFQDLG